MEFYLGIDGGGSGCRAVLADGAGTVLATGQAGPANVSTDAAGSRTAVLAAAGAALTQAFGNADKIDQLHVGMGLAGANAAGAADRLRLGLPFRSTRIETDAVTAVKGALGAADGIVAAIGTGSVFALQRGGSIAQFGGWGFVLGDEGSGARIGRAALSVALRAVDGFVPMTPLLDALVARLGGPAAVVGFAQTARPAEFAALVPEILVSADPAARHIMGQAVAEVEHILMHLRRMADLPVTFVGGLGPQYAARLGHLPQAPAKGTSLDGALMLAREGG